MPHIIINWGAKEEVAQLTAVALLVLLSLATFLCVIISCFCGRENEYTGIKDIDPDALGSAVVETGEDLESGLDSFQASASSAATPTRDESLQIPDSQSYSGYLFRNPPKSINSPGEQPRASSPNKKSYILPRTIPTPAQLSAADKLVQEIDYYVRHMEGFYAVNFYCSVVVLENQLNLSEKWRIRSLRDFIRKGSEFKMRSNMSAFKLTNLTPFREADVQVGGKFRCVNTMCKHYWESSCSFADHFQKCPLCLSRVYPFEQNPLTRAEVNTFIQDPTDNNFIDRGEIAFACRRDSVEALNSPGTPTRSPEAPEA
jgi:hypothetical protein